MLEFRVARAARVTGERLATAVRAALVAANIPEPNAVVCYGVGYTGNHPALNATCNADKMGQGLTLKTALGEESLEILPLAAVTDHVIWNTRIPLVARKLQHSKGRDIRVCRTLAGVRAMLTRGRHDYVTPLVESDTEYRAWVYRRRILAVYEKRLTEPEKNLKFGRNRQNGWTFHSLASDAIPEDVRRVAVAAVRSLNLDFGAVDILGKQTPKGTAVTVLEVNSAPGVSDEHRTAFVKLVNRIVEWVRVGCPARDATPENTNARRRAIA